MATARDKLNAYVTHHTDADEAEFNALLDAFRAEALAEAKREVVGWLEKKAREYRSTGSKQHALQADAIEVMASKAARGAVRLFLDSTAPSGTTTP